MRPVLIAALVGAVLVAPVSAEGASLKDRVQDAVERRDVPAEPVREAIVDAAKDRVEGFQGTSTEGTGIRRAAPSTIARDRLLGFQGESQEGTGIRRAAPGTFTEQEDATPRRPRTLMELFQSFTGESQEGTGIRRAAPGTFAEQEDATPRRPRTLIELFASFQGTMTEGTGI